MANRRLSKRKSGSSLSKRQEVSEKGLLVKLRAFDVSFFILVFMAGVSGFSAISLIVGLPVTAICVPLGFILSLVVYYIAFCDIDSMIVTAICSTSIIVLLTVISILAIDNSYDGASYHKTAIGFLANQWNPLRETPQMFNMDNQIIPTCEPDIILWGEAYPKAIWYFSAPIYQLTGSIESGKVYTMLAMVILFGFACKLLPLSLKKYQRFVVAGIFAFHPIALAQMCSYYVDGFMLSILMLLIILVTSFFEEDQKMSKKEFAISLFCLILYGCNLKFSGALLTAIICVIFFVFTLLLRKNRIKHIFVLLAGSAVFSVFVVGASPYIVNLLRYKNPFYGFLGNAGLFNNIVQGTETYHLSFLGGEFLLSLFSKMHREPYIPIEEMLKIPFTFSPDELVHYASVDVPYGGLGVFFSGLFIVAVLVILVGIKHCINNSKKIEIKVFTCLYLTSFAVCVILPASKWMRFSGYIYLVIPVAVALIFQWINTNRKKAVSLVVLVVLLVGVTCNSIPWAYYRLKQCRDSLKTYQTLQQWKDLPKDSTPELYFPPAFSGLHFNLQDQDIDYQMIPENQLDSSYSRRTFGSWVIYRIAN